MSALLEKELQELKEVDWSRVSTKLAEIVKEREEESVIDIVHQELEGIIEKNRGQEDALLEVLHQAQELIGFVPKAVQKKIARGLKITPGEVASVMSFYAHFSERPKGKYQIALCKGTACYVKGSAEIIEKIKSKYNLEAGETTDDGLLSLEVVRCLGACGLGPVMTVNGKAHGLLNPEKAVNIVEKYKKGEI
ncbi:NAD(P)H-dependent oxidoreductase subunit E [Iocasia frigidifontis]|uniref:NAD(P)H-dependent oxidoreductase subunit E n=1 Tax=Iocasia fonsfrigidae TaxID=2682810 RepID=A0A8A7KCP3_9FIRM|nr:MULTISPECIES: NAD(P)H-dependent oxidoreductase subunit E [Halanaerobiaceae]AZO96234.1 NAD(P)H-dependent oxidoreductase subunit E [Halocella sp. SP3-1]QTL99020.1 NAD(P)H-dependent oxidoreductase subunit E [Iocasia fonsfrigidae]